MRDAHSSLIFYCTFLKHKHNLGNKWCYKWHHSFLLSSTFVFISNHSFHFKSLTWFTDFRFITSCFSTFLCLIRKIFTFYKKKLTSMFFFICFKKLILHFLKIKFASKFQWFHLNVLFSTVIFLQHFIGKYYWESFSCLPLEKCTFFKKR